MSIKNKIIKEISQLGRAMLIPITAMPVAGFLSRIGDTDMLNIPLLKVSADIIFGNMDLLFVFGAVKAYAKSKDLTCPYISGVLTLFIFKSALKLISPNTSMGVFAGILIGVIISITFNKSKEWKLPEMLMFFGGEKLIITIGPIIALPIAFFAGNIWPFFQKGLDYFGHFLGESGSVGIFLFGFFNRLLIPLGLHHVINSYIYFELGSFTNSSGEIIKGEIPRFLAGDISAGFYLTAFFITMVFGIPGAAFGLYKAAKEKKEVEGLYSSAGLTSFFTGITEPLEFSFLFVATPLYIIHAIFTGLSGALAYVFNVRLGGGNFSVIDLILNWKKGTNTFGILIFGLIFFLLYALTFYYVVKKFNFKTPGREEEIKISSLDESKIELEHSNFHYMAKKILQNIGGKENVLSISNCISRLRIEIQNINLVDEKKIKQTGAKGVIKFGDKNIQIIIGAQVEKIKKEIDELLVD